MTRSLAEEIIAILWFILACNLPDTLPVIRWTCIFLGVVAFLSSLAFAILDRLQS
jgi:hypothetical protein